MKADMRKGKIDFLLTDCLIYQLINRFKWAPWAWMTEDVIINIDMSNHTAVYPRFVHHHRFNHNYTLQNYTCKIGYEGTQTRKWNRPHLFFLLLVMTLICYLQIIMIIIIICKHFFGFMGISQKSQMAKGKKNTLKPQAPCVLIILSTTFFCCQALFFPFPQRISSHLHFLFSSWQMINRRSYWKLNNPSVFGVDRPPLVAAQFMAVTLKSSRWHLALRDRSVGDDKNNVCNHNLLCCI